VQLAVEKLVTVATFEFLPDADAMRCYLEQNGLEVFLQDTNTASIWGLSIAVGGIKLQVPSSQVKQATLLVEEFRANMKQRRPSRNDDEDIIFPCEECGMTISFPARRAGGVETCPYCKKYVDVPE